MCPNNLVARMDVLDEQVLATLQDDVCRPAVVEEAIRLALAELAPERQERQRHDLEVELGAVRSECDRLAEAIGRGGPLDALIERLAERQAQRERIEGQLAAWAAQRPRVSVAALERQLRAKLDDWRGLLRRNVAEGRGVLRSLLVGPLRFTPIREDRRRGYACEGLIALDRLLSGVVDLPTSVASPAGFEPAF
ncbi:hypothetical protein BH18ACI5_BH18ACI5_17210 [soil metagenome]